MANYLVSGAGSGIGAAIANRFADEGHTLILLGRTEGKLENVRATLPNSNKHSVVAADVRDGAAIARGLRTIGLQILEGVVANAGVGGENHYGDGDRWDEVLSTNLTGAYVLVNECLPYLRQSKAATRHIALISSILARLGVPNYPAYCASKAGMLGLMRSWAAQFARENILVNAICPGWVETEMASQGIQQLAKTIGQSYDETYRQQMAQVPLNRMSAPAEIANLVSFLFSESQLSITGQAFDINNGALMP